MENRKDFERFAVQYWGHGDVGVDPKRGAIYWTINARNLHNINHLELRSIESLTDEELMRVSLLYGCTPSVLYGKEIIKSAFTDYGIPFSNIRSVVGWIQIIDYLRSIGILVPFDKYSVEQILSLGWAVFKQ